MVFLPAGLRRLVAQKLLHWDIDDTAHLGRSLYLVKHVSMGPHASIGSLNFFRGLDELRFGTGAAMATRNWVAAHPMSGSVYNAPTRTSSLILGDWAKVTNSHIIDVTDRVEIGAHAALAGFRCQILTHSLDLVRDEHYSRPVSIGEHSAVMSGTLLLCGSSVPARCVVSAGSVVTTKLSKEDMLYRGNPALPIRKLPRLRFFERTELEERRDRAL
jgi:UDP-3-O-[3-hydroxymyristoyl] glucosamine N-acyltransferase